MGWVLHVRARVRVSSRWILPAAGAAAGILLSTQAAHAAVTGVSPHGATTVTSDSPLSWDITTDGSSPISCQLNHDGSAVGSPLACNTTQPLVVPAQPPGDYTLTATDATTSMTSTAVHVVPLAPQPTAPASPSNSLSPTFGLGLPADATGATCTVTDPIGNPVVQNVACTDPYTVPLGSSAAQGAYTLAVTATADGESSAPGQVIYTLDTLAPGQPSVAAPTSPDTTRTPAFTITTGAASVTCTASGPNGPVPLTAPCTTTGATLNLAGQPDGDYTLTVIAHDTAGNDSTAGAATYTLDSSVTTPTVTPATTTGSTRSPSFTVTEPDGNVTFACTVTGPDLSATVSACGATTTLNLAGVTDGTYTLHVTATDALGNSSTSTATYTLDTLGPTQPSASSVTSPDKARSVSWTLTGTEPGESYTCATADAGASASCSGNTATLTLTAGAVDGTYTVTVTPLDNLGNPGAPLTLTYDLDATGPARPSASSVTSPDTSRSASWTLTRTESGETYLCATSDPGASVSCSGTTVTLTLTPGAADRTYTVTVTPVDSLGNQGTPLTLTYVLDTTGPVRPAATTSSPASPGNGRTVTWTLTGTEPGETYTCAAADTGASVSCSGTTVTLTLTAGAVDGVYTVTVTPVDDLGNPGAPLTLTYELDTTAPPAPTVASGSPSPGNGRGPSWTVQDGDRTAVTYTCSVTGPAGFAATVSCSSGSTVSLSIAVGSPDGLYSVTVTAVDAAGNPSGTSLTISYLYDTTGPVRPSASSVTSPDNSRSVSWTLTGTESGESYTCAVSGAGASVTCSGSTLVLTLTAGAADGTYTVTVTPHDALGNPGAPLTLTYVLDTTGPVRPSASSVTSPDNSRSVSWTLTGTESGESYTCAVSGAGASVTCSGSTLVLTLTAGAADGTYTVTVTPHDALGNPGAPLTLTYVLDTTGPVRPSASAVGSPGNSRSVTWTITGTEPGETYTCTTADPGASVSCSGTTATLTLTAGAVDGVYSVTVTPVDYLGNPGVPLTLTYELDTTPPPAPVVTAPGSPGNTRHPSFSVVDTEAGVSWACSVSGPGSVVVTSCGPTTVLDMTGASDGTYTVTVTGIDAAGNISDVGTDTYVLDTTPPPAPIVSAPPSPSHDVTPTYGISDTETGAVLTCVLTAPNGQTVYSGSCPADGTFDTGAFGDGSYALKVTATDAAGNASTTTVAWVKDTVPPPAPAVIAPTSPNQSRNPSFTVTDAEGGVVYTCTVTGPSGASVTSCGATTTVNLGGVDGTYTVTVTATDAADNTSTATSATYTLDTTPPTTPSVSTAPSPAQGRSPTFTIGGVETNGVLTCTVTGPAGSSIGMTGPCGTTVGLNLSGQPDGTYTVSVTVTDFAGNVSRAGSASYTLDTTPPVLPSVGTSNSLGHDEKPSFGVTAEQGSSLTCSVARYFQPVWSGPCGPGGSVDLSGYEDGEFEITVFATDAAGNVGPSTTIIYVLDTTPPAAAVLTAPASPSPIVKPVWVFTIEDDTTATCTVTAADGSVVQGPVQCASPFTGLFAGLPDGTYTLTVVVTDAAGNQSVAATSTFVLDRHAPVPPTVLPPTSPDNSHHPEWTISAPKGATLTCTLLSGGTIIAGPSACPADGTFSLAGRPDGTYTLRVTATDAAGNVSATSVTTYVLDTAPPAVPALAYSSSDSVDAHPYWGFSLPAGTIGRCQLWHGGVLIASKNNCKGAVSFDLSGRAAGAYTVRIYAVDGAGNMSHALVASYVLGTRLPGQPSGPAIGTPSGVVPLGGDGTGGGGGGHHHNRPALGQREVQQVLQQFTNAVVPVRTAVAKVAHTANHVASSIIPVIDDKVTEHVSKAVQGVVDAVSQAGGGTGFPLLLLFVVLAFLVMQNRIDRRDPKLALASVAADDTVEFLPPPSRPTTRRAKGKDADR